jgi:hypothetical protein
VSAQPIPDICRVKHGRNPESEGANARVHKTKSQLRDFVYKWFMMNAFYGATCEEASNAIGMRYTTASARISELKADGWLIPTGAKRKTTTGSSAAELRAVTKAERDGKVHPPLQLQLLQLQEKTR